MGRVEFIQYMRPDGHKRDAYIERPDEISDKANKIVAAGFRFECEHLTTGHASLTISDGEEDVAISVVPNGPDVPSAVDEMISIFDIDLQVRLRDERES